jgi:hypothetical protein
VRRIEASGARPIGGARRGAVGERRDDRARRRLSRARARTDELDERAAHALQVPQPRLDRRELRLGEPARRLAAAAVGEPQEAAGLLEGEPELLRALDEPEPRDRVLAVAAEPVRRARGFGDQPEALVVAQRLDMHPRGPRRRADRHAIGRHRRLTP